MPPRSDVARSTRRLFVWFALTTLVPAVALVWLGRMLVLQDLANQVDARAAARDQVAELVTASMQRRLADLDEQLSSLLLGGPDEVTLPAGVAALRLTRNDVAVRAGVFLPFYPGTHPTVAVRATAAADVLARADAREFAASDPDEALSLVRALTDAPEERTRAEAWLRVARLELKLGRLERALDAWEQLTTLGPVVVSRPGSGSGDPAGLIGLQGRALAFEAAGRTDQLAETATRIVTALDEGRWTLDRLQYEFARDQAADWLDRAGSAAALGRPDDERVALAEAAEAAWRQWTRAAETSAPSSRARTTYWSDRPVLTVTRSTPDALAMVLVGPAFLTSAVADAAEASGAGAGFDVALTDADRLVVGETLGPAARDSSRTPSATSLPWTVHVIDREPAPTTLSRSAVVMLGAIGVMLSLVGIGGYVVTRTLTRELRVARMQSDFVAAVSHEFRTPLTTVRHLSELLARDRVAGDGRKREFYGILVRESDRLQRLVESVLSFARLESGELEYRFAPVLVEPFLREIVEDFRQERVAQGATITFAGDAGRLGETRADRELLAQVVWNLLDNAVKYSPGVADVRVEASAGNRSIEIRVSDRGMGIPADEQPQIFRKFVRGAAAKAASIKGTGIGLATAAEIVRAHGGDITVESHEGKGSTFTVRLPAVSTVPVAAPGPVGPIAPVGPVGPVAPLGPRGPV